MAFFLASPRDHRDRAPLRVHALRTEHRAGHRVRARGGRLAARPRRAVRPRARPVQDPRPVPRVRHRCVHGAQRMNGILQDVGRGTDRLVAARATFRRRLLAGLTAILTDAVGFAVLALVDVPAIAGSPSLRPRRRRPHRDEPPAPARPPVLRGRSRAAAARALARTARGNARQAAGPAVARLDRFTGSR